MFQASGLLHIPFTMTAPRQLCSCVITFPLRPHVAGVGLACVLRLMITSVYHGVLVAYSLYFMFASLPQPYSWGSCTEPWATAGCQNQTCVLRMGYTGGDSSPESHVLRDHARCHLPTSNTRQKLSVLWFVCAVPFKFLFFQFCPGQLAGGTPVF